MTDKHITQAFEQMGPTPEAEERMLANILAATEAEQARPANASTAAVVTAPTTPSAAKPITVDNTASHSEPKAQPGSTPAHNKSAKRISPWKVALPIAASLILLAGIGFFVASGIENSANHMAYMTMEAASGESAMDSAAPYGEEDNSEASPKSGGAETYNATPPPEGEESTDGGINADLPAKYPYIEFTDASGIKTWFMICIDGQGNAQQPDLSWIGKSLGAATAWNAELTEPIACTLYECPTTAIPYYIVQYDGDSAYYLALSTEKPS